MSSVTVLSAALEAEWKDRGRFWLFGAGPLDESEGWTGVAGFGNCNEFLFLGMFDFCSGWFMSIHRASYGAPAKAPDTGQALTGPVSKPSPEALINDTTLIP